MAANKKPRKAYKPKYRPGALPIQYGLSREMKTDMRLPYHLSLDLFKRGLGTDDDAHQIVSALLVGHELAKLYSPQASQAMQEAIDAISAVKARGDQTGQWGVSGDQFRAISEALVLMDDMQEGASRREVRNALMAVWKAAA